MVQETKADTKTDKPKREADVQVTYVPGPQDPPIVKWMGHTFHANSARPVTHQGLIDAAKRNPFFRVDDGKGNLKFEDDTDPRVRVEKMFAGPQFIDVATLQQFLAQVKPEIEPSVLADRYRKHAVAWLRDTQSTRDLISRWAKDTPLRDLCGVGHDDYAYLGTLFRPKLAELRRAEEIDDRKFMAISVEYGITQFPW